jgi:hypothetical protein
VKSKKAELFLSSKFFLMQKAKKMKKKKSKNHPNFATIFGLQYERVLKISLLSYFEYCQIWLNFWMIAT